MFIRSRRGRGLGPRGISHARGTKSTFPSHDLVIPYTRRERDDRKRAYSTRFVHAASIVGGRNVGVTGHWSRTYAAAPVIETKVGPYCPGRRLIRCWLCQRMSAVERVLPQIPGGGGESEGMVPTWCSTRSSSNSQGSSKEAEREIGVPKPRSQRRRRLGSYTLFRSSGVSSSTKVRVLKRFRLSPCRCGSVGPIIADAKSHWAG